VIALKNERERIEKRFDRGDIKKPERNFGRKPEKKPEKREGFSGGFDPAENVIEGRNALVEVIKAGRAIDKVFVARGELSGSLGHLAARAKELGAVIVECDRRKLDSLSSTGAHQGVIAYVAAHEYTEFSELMRIVHESDRPALIVVCDEISDPHNLGAIIRSAEAAGAHGVIIPKRRSVGLSAVVAKASAGALEHMPVVRETNLPDTIDRLKEEGIWVYGTGLSEKSVNLYDTDLTGPAAIVIGSEGDGIGRLVASKCDVMMKIPMPGTIQSLNASAAAAVTLFETVRQRLSEKGDR